MTAGAVALIRTAARYPKEAPFSPSERYPEAAFADVSPEENLVYAAVRQGFLSLGMDAAHAGTKDWNPLGDVICPGDTVLLKPNWVMHENDGAAGDDLSCLVTHPSVLRAALDYTVLALRGRGRILVADAPIQVCDLPKLWEKTGLDRLFDFYRAQGVALETLDLRGLIAKERKDGTFLLREQETQGVPVDLSCRSLFQAADASRIERLRITNYPVGQLQAAHGDGKHVYLVHPAALEADVILNLPKPKSHRKAGLTAAAKNFVGVNTRKEYLPHHTVGGPASGGDEFSHDTALLHLAAAARDRYNNENYAGSRLAPWTHLLAKGLEKLGRMTAGERFREGSWYGNDTVWRMLMDLNLAVEYAKKDSTLCDTPQRRLFHLCDMVVSGEGEGPLEPEPKPVGLIAMGGSAAAVDRVICAAAGFDPAAVRYIRPMMARAGLADADVSVVSADGEAVPLPVFPFDPAWALRPADGWIGHIETKEARP